MTCTWLKVLLTSLVVGRLDLWNLDHFGCKGASPSMETVNPFMKLSHDIVCLLAVQVF